MSNKVFIVHGHDNAMKNNVSKFIKDLGYAPVILHQQSNRGKTIIEKFETNSDVVFAIILMSPDDEGKSVRETTIRKRARQNVVFEFGYFIGKLGREKVCVLIRDNVEKPSDIDGLVYINYKKGQWRNPIKMELNEVASISHTVTIDNDGKRENLSTPNIILSDFDLKRLKAWTSVDRPDFWQFHAANGNRRYGLGTQNKYDVTTGKEKVEWDSFFERLQMLGFIEIKRYDKKGYPVYSLKKAAYDFMENQE